jgi:hypothetical protein
MDIQDQKIVGVVETLKVVQTPDVSNLERSNNPRQSRTIISKSRNCFIEVLHRGSDPSIWIVRRWKRILFFKKRISSDWFINRQQAYTYAYEMLQNNQHHRLYDAKEM